MASEKIFETIPAFPDDVPTVSICTVSLADLNSGDSCAARSLLGACQELGFFLLDLRGDALGETVIKEIDRLFETGKGILNQPDEVKTQYAHDPPKSFLGYKPMGTAKTGTNQADRFEWFNLGQDGLLNDGPRQPLPGVVDAQLPLFKSFLEHGQIIVSTINTILAVQLGLARDTFTRLQSPTKPSGTVIRLIKSHASKEEKDIRTSMMHHTDFGSITLLANVLGGLQILQPGKAAIDESGWLYVHPTPGCLIVNLGDAMVQWTGGMLRSNCHRINCSPGEQRFVDRYSLAIFVRPERDASMKSLVGETEDGEDGNLTAWEWEVNKMMSLKRGDAVMESKGGRAVTGL